MCKYALHTPKPCMKGPEGWGWMYYQRVDKLRRCIQHTSKRSVGKWAIRWQTYLYSWDWVIAQKATSRSFQSVVVWAFSNFLLSTSRRTFTVRFAYCFAESCQSLSDMKEYEGGTYSTFDDISVEFGEVGEILRETVITLVHIQDNTWGWVGPDFESCASSKFN